MKQYFDKKSIILFFISFSLLSFPTFAQNKSLLIKISQDQSIQLNDFQTNITLKKKQFKFQVMLENMRGVYVFASIKDSVYRYTDTGVIQDFVYLPILELREDEFNDNKELNISETGWSYWFYDQDVNWHPFNRRVIGLGKGKKLCTKNIRQFYDVANFNTIKIKDINTPLYLFFVAVAEYDANGNPSKELLRRKVKIDWINDDDN